MHEDFVRDEPNFVKGESRTNVNPAFARVPVLHTRVMTYTRRPVHWETDTNGRKAFEREVRRTLKQDGEFEILDSTDSFDEIDFELGCRGKRIFLEVKEKKQKYRDQWEKAGGIDQRDLFIIDELAARKVVLRAPRAYVVVRDCLNDRMVTFGALELITLPKVRVNRSIDGGVATFKGKWLIDLRHGDQSLSLSEALAYVKRRASSEEELWKSLACHGRYTEETVPRF